MLTPKSTKELLHDIHDNQIQVADFLVNGRIPLCLEQYLSSVSHWNTWIMSEDENDCNRNLTDIVLAKDGNNNPASMIKEGDKGDAIIPPLILVIESTKQSDWVKQ